MVQAALSTGVGRIAAREHVSGAALIPITQGCFFGSCFATRPIVIRTRAVSPCEPVQRGVLVGDAGCCQPPREWYAAWESRGSPSGRSARAARSRAPAVRASSLRGAGCDPRARRPRRHSLHRRGGSVFAPWFRVLFAGGGSADYNGHELAPLLVTSENNSRLWFYDFSTDWLAGIYPDWFADSDPGYRGYGGAGAQLGGPISCRRQGVDGAMTKMGTVLSFVPLCSTGDLLNGSLFTARDRNNFELIVEKGSIS